MPIVIESPFILNKEYRRREIHARFGGNWQGGICPSSTNPFIFIFSGESGQKHGYNDLWENSYMFAYTGEGQVGNMQFTRGNLALRDHIKNGKRVFLFRQNRKGYVRYEAELVLHEFDFFPIIDSSGEQRQGIKFFFQRAESTLKYDLTAIARAEEPLGYDLPTITERSGLVVSRVGQGAYRKSIINRWEYKCAVTGFTDPRILIASHIHPWKNATNQERLDVNNGILLSPTFDALFDKHMITFENNGKIVLSEKIDSGEYKKVGVSGTERIQNLRGDNLYYLEKHQSVFNNKVVGQGYKLD